ncbi:MAG: ATP-grasp domain-containing protein [Rickettsiales bacterium]|jgi:hypothetical protein|nr:ATP-grasp domain-containing protein [Rickettsiales bacterium]
MEKIKRLAFIALGVCLPLVITAKADTPLVEAARAAAQRQQVVIIPQQTQTEDSELESRAATVKPQVIKSNSPLVGESARPQAAPVGGRTMPSNQSRTAITTAQPDASRAVVQRRGQAAQNDRGSEGSRASRAGATDFTETKSGQARTAVSSRASGGRASDSSSRQTVAEVGGRAVVARTGEYTMSNFDGRGNSRARTSRARAAAETEEVVIDPMIESMVKEAALTSCSARYDECMDQFCNIIDERQQRCSCSANLKNYQAAEEQLKKANQELNNVAQNIRYVGLSAEEIRTLFSETEAEQAMRNVNDRSANRTLLAEIEDIISGATSNLAGGAQGGGNLFDISLEDGMDLSEIFGGSGQNMASLRGKQLRDAAAKKCKSILDDCKKEGVANDQLTGGYDLRVEKDCAEYEQSLKRMHESVTNNIRSANTMLQKARLAVLYDQNEYDFKECVQAIDQCILEDTSCGKNYLKCLDPSRTYLDEAGKVILGSNLPELKAWFNNIVSQDGVVKLENKIIINLKNNKIGEPGKSGMCSDAMKNCRRLTYRGQAFNPENEVLKAFLAKAGNQMKVSAERVIADFAGRCMNEVGTCYNTQITNLNAWTSGFTNVSAESVKNVMLGACRSVATTCARSIFFTGQLDDDTTTDIGKLTGKKPLFSCTNDDDCIERLSDIFYNSLLCGPNMAYDKGTSKCYCMAGYELVGGYCRQCPGSQIPNSNPDGLNGWGSTTGQCPGSTSDLNKMPLGIDKCSASGSTGSTVARPAGWITCGTPLAIQTTCCAEVKAP